MCLAVPARIKEIEQGMAKCSLGDSDTIVQASLMLLDEEAAPGDYVLIHAGFAIRRLDLEEARETLRLMRDMVREGGGMESW
jgi:hydrogenase expression/formation protein HypC